MDYKLLAFSALAVFGVLSASGVVISMISTYMQCSKVGFGTSVWESTKAAVLPTIGYILAAAFLVVRHPFSSTFKSFGVPEETAIVVGVGYLPMLVSWVTMVSNVQNSEKTVCQADLKEMSDFRKKMMAELAEKEKAKEAHMSKK
jgi:uncharacterized membrane protein